MRLFKYCVKFRNPVEEFGQLDAFYPHLTIVLRWPVVVGRCLTEDDIPF